MKWRCLVLHELGIKYGTDKAGHGYLPIYERYFADRRGSVFNLLEIGVHMGASLKMWRDYFPNAQIHGIDNVPQKKELESDRITIHIGSQDNRAFLHDVAYANPFDIIIDDGSHMMEHQIISFETLFPCLNRGGLYIIEDLHTSYHVEFLGSRRTTTMDYLTAIIDDVNMFGYNYGNKTRTAKPSYYEQNIRAMHFHKSLCIIEKI
jgi:hypothetical protein